MITTKSFMKIDQLNRFTHCGGLDEKILPASGTNQIARFVEFHLLTSLEKDKLRLQTCLISQNCKLKKQSLGTYWIRMAISLSCKILMQQDTLHCSTRGGEWLV